MQTTIHYEAGAHNNTPLFLFSFFVFFRLTRLILAVSRPKHRKFCAIAHTCRHTRTIKQKKKVAVLKSCAEITCASKDTVLHKPSCKRTSTLHRRVKGSRVTAKIVDPWDKPKSKLSPINDHKTNTARIHERERERAGRNDEDDDRQKRGLNRSRTLGPQFTTPIKTSASMRRPTATSQTVGDFKF